MAVVVEAARAAVALRAGAAARAAPEVCGRPVNQARRLAAAWAAAEPVQAVLAVEPEMAAAVEAAQAVAADLVVADLVVADRVVVGREEEAASAARAEEQVVAGLVVEAAREAEPEVEQAVGPAL